MARNTPRFPVCPKKDTRRAGLCIILLSTICLHGGQGRFQRLATLYNPPVFLLTGTSVSFSGSSFKTTLKPFAEVETRDSLQPHQMYTDMACRYLRSRKRSIPAEDQERIYSASIRTQFFNHGITALRQTSPKLYMDTNRYEIDLNIAYKNSKACFGNPLHRHRTPFCGVQFRPAAAYALEYQWNFVPFYDQVVSDKMNHFKCYEHKGLVSIDLFTMFGIGREIEYMPLYQAFNLEKTLIQKNIADFFFSDATILKLMNYLALHRSYIENTIETQKATTGRLDSLLGGDESISKRNIRFVTPLESARFFNNHRLELIGGFSSRIITAFRLQASVHRNSTTFPYRTLPVHSIKTKVNTAFSAYCGGELSYGFPINRWSFFSTKTVKSFLWYSSGSGLLFRQRGTLREALDTRWEIHYFLLLASWVYLHTGVSNLPAWLCIPQKIPDRIFVDGNLIVNHRLRLTLGCFHTRSNAPYPAYSYCTDSNNEFLPASTLSLLAHYSL